MARVLERKTGGFLQFLKYAFVGGIATGILAAFVFLAIGKGDPILRFIRLPIIENENLRGLHFAVDTTLAFVVSNFVCYLMNRKWVFTPGRHSVLREMGMFYAVSGVAMGVGMGIAWLLIECLGMHSTFAVALQVTAAVMINYVMRKYVIFKR